MDIKPPKMTFKLVRRVLLFSLFTSLLFLSGYFIGKAGYEPVADEGYPKVTITRELPENREDLDFSLFWRVWDTLESRYYDKSKLVEGKMVYGAIGGMVSALEDPYTVFLPPSENKVVQEDLKGNFEGVGIQIGFRGTQLAVIAPLPKSPAEEVGIQAGDYIIGIKDESKNIDRGTSGITLPEAVQTIRGEAGTKVTLTLLRDGAEEPIIVDVTRKSINVPSVVVEYVEDEKVAHIKVLKFAAETQDEWNNALAEIIKRPQITGIVVDVRNNPGGYLQGAIDLSTDFLENGTVAVIEQGGDGFKEEFKTQGFPRLKKYNTVVLVNGGSASASEILAGALRDQKKVKLIGETTFGKGTIQEPQQINGGSGLHITIAKWLTPNGTWVHENGLEPDVVVENNPETDEDEQLLEAVKNVLQG